MGDPTSKKPKLKLGHRFLLKNGAKNRPPSGRKWVRGFDLIAKYKASIKDSKKISVQTIAAIYGIQPRELMLLNWKTSDPEEVNWYLYNWVGCRESENGMYCFSQADSPGRILVPEKIEHAKIGQPQQIQIVRDSKATHDARLQVFVKERLPDGSTKMVEGKWLYVFSGPGLDFGFKKITHAPASGDDQPGSAGFTLDFPGKLSITNRPDTLEYEIYISSKNGPTSETLTMAFGEKADVKPRFQYGRKWYSLPKGELKNALTQPRDKRINKHETYDSDLVSVELYREGIDRRYYFLLSPVQLGPEAFKFAMENPSGLTPLLQPNAFIPPDRTDSWDDEPTYWKGPAVGKVFENPLTLGVIDPFAWARHLAEITYPKALNTYVEWIGSKQNDVVAELAYGSKWPTLDHVMVAKTLAAIIRVHPKGDDIKSELRNANEFFSHLEIWEEYLLKETERINIDLQRSLVQLIDWLDGDAHAIIETAILKDTRAKTPVDALDKGCGILHWSSCLETAYLFAPGLAYLRRILKTQGRIPFDLALRPLVGIDKPKFDANLNDFDRKVIRYGHAGVINLQSLSDFVLPRPDSGTASKDQFWNSLADVNTLKRANLIKFFNDQKLLPVVLEAANHPNAAAPEVASGISLPVVNGILSVADIITSWAIDRSIAKETSIVMNQIIASEDWYKIKTLSIGQDYTKWENEQKVRWKTRLNSGVRVVSFGLGLWNLRNVLTATRYDYELKKYVRTSTLVDYGSAVAGVYSAAIDIFSMFGAKYPKDWLARTFPDFGDFAKGSARTIAKGGVVTWVGRTVVQLNVAMMLITGVTTIISLGKNRDEALDLGNYTAAKFYRVGQIGGLLMIGGGLSVGVAVAFSGLKLALIGTLTTVGAFLFIIGGFVAALFTLLGTAAGDDPFVLFARKCFFGKQFDISPRFGGSPPAWSLASKSDNTPTDETNPDGSWPINYQRRALFNLIGMSKVSTKIAAKTYRNAVHTVDVFMTVELGYFMDDYEMEIALHVTRNGSKDSAIVKWDANENGYKILPLNANGVIDPGKLNLKDVHDSVTKQLKTSELALGNIKFNQNRDLRKDLSVYKDGEGLWTTVTIRNKQLGIVIGTQKQVCFTSKNSWDMLTPDESKKLSDFFTE